MGTARNKVRLVLVGAGHAHMEVIRRLILSSDSWADVTVVSQFDKHHYSGMVPGYLRGSYLEEEISFDLPPLIAAAGGEFICKRAIGVDPTRRVVRLEGGGEVEYDIVSFNVGSRTIGGDSAGPDAALVKPMSRAVDLHRRILELAHRDGSKTRHVAVVGGGSAGVEIACAMAAVLDDAGGRREARILEGSDRILPGYSGRFRDRAESILEDKKITVRTGRRVVKVHRDAVELEDGSRVESGLTVWLTGAAGPGIFEDSKLELDSRGFLLVDDSLRSLSDPKVFGVGDCVTLANHPATPKAGVYAVREAPVLWESLLSAVGRGSRPRYQPQDGFLSILNTGDGKALLRYKSYITHSLHAWWIKDWIDRRFVAKYQSLVGAN
jgi:pyridine nucleotide-disulfide oxidoreductase family protein